MSFTELWTTPWVYIEAGLGLLPSYKHQAPRSDVEAHNAMVAQKIASGEWKPWPNKFTRGR